MAKKAKKNKKKLKVVLIAASICFVLVASVVAGAVVVLCGNDFAMTTLITHDIQKAYEDCLETDTNIFNFAYYEATVTIEQKNLSTDESMALTWYIRAIKKHDDTYNYIATSNVVFNQPIDVTLYYKNGKLFRKHHYIDYNHSETTEEQTSDPYAPLYWYGGVATQLQPRKIVFPSSAEPIFSPDNFISLQTSFTYNFPFDFGQKYVLSYENNKTATYHLLYNGTIKQRSFSMMYENISTETITVTYHSYNKVFLLNFPEGL